VNVHDEFEPEPLGGRVAERDHLPEFPFGIDVQQRERRLGRKERLAGEVQQDARILADRIEQHRLGELGRHLAQNENRFRFQISEMQRKFFGQ